MNRLYLDIETNLAHDKIWCCYIKDSDGNSVSFTENSVELQGFINLYDEVVAHNGIGFDFPVLERVWGIKVPKEKQRDTLVLSRLVNPNLPGGHSLKNWGTLLGVKKMDFEVEDFDAGLTDEMIDYCMRDVEVLAKVDKRLDEHLSKWKDPVKPVVLEHKVAQIMYDQEQTGFKLNIPYASALLGELRTRMGQIESELQATFPPITTERYSEKTGKRLKDDVEVFNVGSRQQIAKRLQGLGVKFTKTTDKGSIIVDEQVLAEIDLPEAQLCLEYLTIQKRVGMVDSWLEKVAEDGRVHGKVITNGAVTGRMTQSRPNLAQVTSVKTDKEGKVLEGREGGYGKESRECWTVEQGNVLVGCDLSGIELRCLAHYMQDEEWTRELLGGDIHTKNQLAAGLDTRAQAKTFCYAVLYGAGAAKVGSIINKGRNEGKKLMDNFYKNTPALKALKEKVERIAERNKIVPGVDGRALHIRATHSALNTLLQGCGAIIAKQWIIEVDEELERRGLKKVAKQVVCVHDEIQLEVREDYAQEVAQILQECATRAGETLGIRLPIEAESKVGSNWFQTH